MANNYTHVSCELRGLTPAECEWVESYLVDWDTFLAERADLETEPITLTEGVGRDWAVERACSIDEVESWPEFDWLIFPNDAGNTLWIHDDGGYVDVDQIAAFVHRFLKQFRPDEGFKTTWACTCSKPRVDEFGGGAIVATAKGWRAAGAQELYEDLLKEIEDE